MISWSSKANQNRIEKHKLSFKFLRQLSWSHFNIILILSTSIIFKSNGDCGFASSWQADRRFLVYLDLLLVSVREICCNKFLDRPFGTETRNLSLRFCFKGDNKNKQL